MMNVKFVSAVLLFGLWSAALVAKHFWSDIDIHTLELAITAALGGLGVTQIRK